MATPRQMGACFRRLECVSASTDSEESAAGVCGFGACVAWVCRSRVRRGGKLSACTQRTLNSPLFSMLSALCHTRVLRTFTTECSAGKGYHLCVCLFVCSFGCPPSACCPCFPLTATLCTDVCRVTCVFVAGTESEFPPSADDSFSPIVSPFDSPVLGAVRSPSLSSSASSDPDASPLAGPQHEDVAEAASHDLLPPPATAADADTATDPDTGTGTGTTASGKTHTSRL